MKKTNEELCALAQKGDIAAQNQHTALEMIENREERYLRYRFGFEDDCVHKLTETARRFHLSEAVPRPRRSSPWTMCDWSCRGGMSSVERFSLHPS